MKCIKHANGKLSRVSDEQAEKLVRSNQAVFISKSEYKEARSNKESRS
jgi:hypothetical protein